MAEISVSNGKLCYLCGERTEELDLPESVGTMIVSCDPVRLTFISRKTARLSFLPLSLRKPSEIPMTTPSFRTEKLL